MEKIDGQDKGYTQADLNAVASDMRRSAIEVFDDPASSRERAAAAMVLAGHIEKWASHCGANDAYAEMCRGYTALQLSNGAMSNVFETLANLLGTESGSPENLIQRVLGIGNGLNWMEARKVELCVSRQGVEEDSPEFNQINAQVVEVMQCLNALGGAGEPPAVQETGCHEDGAGTDEEFWASEDGEVYQCGPASCREEALAMAVDEFDLEPGDSCSVGEKGLYVPSVCGWRVVDAISDQAYERCGELVDGWPDISKDEEESLSDALSAALVEWLRKSGHLPNFFPIVNDEEMVVPGEEGSRAGCGTDGLDGVGVSNECRKSNESSGGADEVGS